MTRKLHPGQKYELRSLSKILVNDPVLACKVALPDMEFDWVLGYALALDSLKALDAWKHLGDIPRAIPLTAN
jgi:hypothetical protein